MNKVYTAKDVEKLQRIMVMVNEMVDLDAKISDETDTTIGEMVADSRVNVEREADASFQKNIINEALNVLSPSEKAVITLKYGLVSNKFMKLDDVAAIFGVSRQRVSQLELQGLEKLRNYMRTKQYKFEDLIWEECDGIR